MFGWLAQVYEAMSAPLLEWTKARAVDNAVVISANAGALTEASSVSSLRLLNTITDSIHAKNTGISSVSEYAVLTSTEWLSTLESSTAFDIRDADIPMFSMSSETTVILMQPGISSGMSHALTSLPALLFMPTYPVFSVGLFVLQQIIQTHAHCMRDANIESEDITKVFKTRHIDGVIMRDVSAEFSVQDRTEQYRARRLQSNNAACNGSQIIFPEAKSGWASTLGGAGDDEGQSIGITSDGGSILAGYTNSFGAGGYDVLIAKFNSIGGLLWAKTLGGISDEKSYSLAVMANDGFVLTGFTGNSGFLACLNSIGSLQWAKTLLGGAGQSLVLTTDGGILLLQTSGTLTRFNSTAGLLWAVTLGEFSSSSGFWDALQSGGLALTSDGGFALTGPTGNYFATNMFDILVARFNSTGGLLWANTLGGTGWQQGFNVVVTASDQVIVVGGNIAGAALSGPLLARFDSVGRLLWANAVDIGGYPYKGALASDGGIMLIGSGGDLVHNVVLARFNSTGDLLWVQFSGGLSNDQGFDLAMRLDGGMVLTGAMSSFGSGGADIFILSLKTLDRLPQTLGVLSINSVNRFTQSVMSDVSLSQIALTGTRIIPVMANWGSYSIASVLPNLTPLTYVINIDAFNSVLNAPLTYGWSYTLPSVMYLQLPIQPNLQIDFGQSDWLSYNAVTRILFGVPILSATGEITIRITPMSLIVPGAGVFHFNDIILTLCVLEEDRSFQSLISNYQTGDKGLVITSDGGKVVTGEYNYQVLVAKFNSNNELLWAKTILAPFYSGLAYGLVVTRENEIYLTGAAMSFSADYDILIVHFNSIGELYWVKTLGGAGYDSGNSLAISADGSIVLVGNTAGFGAICRDILLAKFNTIGGLQWARKFGTASSCNYGNSVSILSDGGIIITGQNDYFVFLSKFDVNGVLLWAKDFGTSNILGIHFSAGTSLAVSVDEDVILTGSTGYPHYGGDILVARFNSTTGSLMWIKTLGGALGDYGNGVVLSSNGDVFLTGQTENFGTGSSAILLARFNFAGDLIWVKTLNGAFDVLGQSLAMTQNGGLALMGSITGQGVLLANFDDQGKSIATDGISLHDVTAQVTLTTINLIPTDVTSALNVSNIVPAMIDITASSSLQDVASSLVRTVGFLRTKAFPPVTQLPFGQPYLLDIGNNLGIGVSLLTISEWQKSFLPAWLMYNSTSYLLSGTPTGRVRGFYYIDMSLELAGQNNDVVFILNVTNTVPYLAISVFDIKVGRFIIPLGSLFSDNENDLIGPYVITQSNGTFPPAIGSIDAVSGRLFGTALSGDQGTYIFNISASDPYNTGWQLITVNVKNTPPNQQYDFSNPDPVTVGNKLSYSFPSNAFADRDGDPVSYTASTPAFLTFNPSSQTLSGTLVAATRGIYSVYFFASDPYGGVSNVSIVVSVNGIPAQQLSLSTLITTPVNVPYAFTLPVGLFVDPDGDAVSYTLTEDIQHIKPSWLLFNSTNNMLSGMPNANTHQPIPIRFTVSDGRGGQTFYDVSLSIPNSAPAVVNGMISQSININQVKTVVISNTAFNDADQDALIYQLVKSDGSTAPDFVSMATNAMTFTPRSGAQGTYVLRLIASDPFSASANTIFVVTVPNRSPILAEVLLVPTLVTVGNLFSYSFSGTAFSDPDNDAIQYAASFPNFLLFDSNTRTFTGVPSIVDRGFQNLTINATDNYGGLISKIVTMIVNGIPAQQLSLLTLTTTPVNVSYAFTLPTGLFVDPDGDAVSYALTEDLQHPKPSWLLFNSTNNMLLGTPNANTHQPMPIRFTVSDGRGGQIFYDISLSIPNSVPMVHVGVSNQSIAVNQVRSLVIPNDAFVDADRDALVYVLNLLSGHSQNWLSLANGVITFFPRSGDQGNYQFILLANDGQGGQAELIFNATVPNHVPQLMYPIPAPAEGRSQQLWSTTLLASNFADADLDPLTYTANTVGISSLPTWMTFDPVRLLFQGVPAGVNRGITPLRVTVSDGFGGIVMGYMNVTVVNSAPVPEGRVLDQQASQTESSFIFTVPTFIDPDGDAVVYSAQMQHNQALLAWIQFDASTRVFTTLPTQATPGNYLVNVVATDSQGLNQTSTFNLAIQSPPQDAPTSLAARLQALAPTLGSAGLVVLFVLLIIWRYKRIQNTNQQIQNWSSMSRGEATGQGDVTFAMLTRDLRGVVDLLSECAPMTQIEESVQQFRDALRQYYRGAVNAHPLTALLDTQIIEGLIQFSMHHREELMADIIDTDNILGAAKLLHLFMRLLLSEHSGRGRKLHHETKVAYLDQLNQLISCIPTKSVAHIEILYQLYSAREALICVVDTHTLQEIFVESVTHLLSPGDLLSDVKKFALDFPSQWYVALLNIHLLANRAIREIATLINTQEKAAIYKDWRFLFGMIPVLLEIVLNAEDDAIRQQALKGEVNKGKITKLGFLHLLTIKNTMFYPHRERVREQAAVRLRAVSSQLKDTEITQLEPFLAMIPSLTRGERVERVASSRNVIDFASTNPMFTASGRGLFRPAMSGQVQLRGLTSQQSTEEKNNKRRITMSS